MFLTSWQRWWMQQADRLAPQRRGRSHGARRGRYRPAVLPLEDRLLLSVCTVNSLTDTGAGSGSSGDLRYCLRHVHSGDSVTFSVTGTINLTQPLPTLSDRLTITGPGSGSLTVEPSNPDAFRIFTVAAGASIEISGLTLLRGGAIQGGGILNNGTLIVSDTLLLGDEAINMGSSTSSGGAIYNGGILTVLDSQFKHNNAFSSGATFGGAIYNGGILAVQDSLFEDSNIISMDTNGGAIYNAHGKAAAISGSTFTFNSSGLGGGIDNDGTLMIDKCTFASNIAGSGGSIYSDAILTVTDSTFSDRAYGKGGSIDNAGGMATVSDSMFSHNGAVPNFGGPGGSGGAIDNESGTLTVSSSTLADNEATFGGGIANAGTLTVRNTTIAHNRAFSIPRTSFFGTGGGIFTGSGSSSSPVNLLNSTIADNTADGSNVHGGGLYISGSGTSFVRTRDLLLAGNTAALGPDLVGTLASLGHNLIQNPSQGSGFVSSDLLGVNPLLDPNGLQNNGGPTQTIALEPGSPAIDAGDNTGAPRWDQRGPGFPRIVNGIIDIGAFEVQNSHAVTFRITAPDKVAAGSPFVITVTALGASGQVAAGYTGTVNFSTSDHGAGVVLPADYTFTLADGGVHRFTNTGRGETTLVTGGSQTLTVTDTAAPSVLGRARVKVRHRGHHDGGDPGLPASQDLAAGDRFFAALAPGDFGLLASSSHHRHRQTGGS